MNIADLHHLFKREYLQNMYSESQYWKFGSGSNLVFADLDGFIWVVLAVESHIVDGVLLLHPIVHNNDLKVGNDFYWYEDIDMRHEGQFSTVCNKW